MKNKIFIIIAVTWFCMIALSMQGYSQPVGTTSMQFLKVMPHAQAVSMAGAYVTLAHGSESVFWNPAGLVNISGIFIYTLTSLELWGKTSINGSSKDTHSALRL